MIDSGADPADIGAAVINSTRETVKTEPLNWKEQEHLETDFTQRPALPVQVDAELVDRPPSRRVYGAPIYDQNGDLRCRCCGRVMGRGGSNGGDSIASCSDPGCNANGMMFAEGSSVHNPHRSGLR